MEIRWKTYTHIDHPFGDLLWHLFWGIIVGGTIVYAIIYHDFWGLVIGGIALVFFFHPKFYEPRLMDVRFTEEGFYIDKKFYSWEKFYAFEIFDNGYRKFVFLFPKRFSFGLHFPLEEFFVSEKEVKDFLKKYLEEQTGKIPFPEKIYRSLYL